MEEALLMPGRLLTPETAPRELEKLKDINSQLNKNIALYATSARAGSATTTISKEILGSLQKIEKSENDEFIGANALNMTDFADSNENDLLALGTVAKNSTDYLVCAKSDGVRYLMFLCSNGRVYLNDRKNQFFEARVLLPPIFASYHEMRKLKEASKHPDASNQADLYTSITVDYIFDGELVLNINEAEKVKTILGYIPRLHFLIFDTIIHKSENLCLYTYEGRLQRAKEFMDQASLMAPMFKKHEKQVKDNASMSEFAIIQPFVKDFYKCKHLEFLMNKIIDGGLLPHENDGLIFTKNNYPYLPGRNRGILKWKPLELNTVDFLVCESTYMTHPDYEDLFTNDDFFVLELYTIFGNNLYFFDFLFIFDYSEYIQLMGNFREVNSNKDWYGNVVECNYDFELKSTNYHYYIDRVYDSSSDSIYNLLQTVKFGYKPPADDDSNEGSDQEDGRNQDRVGANSKILVRNAPKDYVSTLFDTFEKRYNEEGSKKGGWKVIRERNDKNFPNNYTTASSTLKTIFESNINKEELIKRLVADQQIEGNNKKLKAA